MRNLLLAAAAAGAIFAISTPASARDGCGSGFHRVYHGRCVPNGYRGDRYRGDRHHGDRYREGGYYHGRGYWSRGQFYQNRYRHHRDWRYR